MTTKILI